jgi:vacuolar-type H+-ATPase subunit E/Vma4
MMKSTDENINSLSREILTEAREEAEQILVEANLKANTIRRQAQEQADEVRGEMLERAQQNADRIKGQAIANAQLKARTRILGEREKIIDQVFSACRQRLPSVQQWNDYDQVAIGLLKEAISRLNTNQVEFKADPITIQHLTKEVLDEINEELEVQIRSSGNLQKGIGVIAETNNGRMQYVNTLEVRLNRLKNSLRSSVYHIMMGEQI